MLTMKLSKNWRLGLHFWFRLYVPRLAIYAYKTDWVYDWQEFNTGMSIPGIGSFGLSLGHIRH